MTTLPITSMNTIISTSLHPARAMPICLRAAKYLSATSAMTAVATLIYGIAANLFPFIAMGTIFLASSLTCFYLIHQVVNLKTIEEDTKEIKLLTATLSDKNDQIKQLTSQISAVSDKFAALNKDYARMSAADNTAQKNANQQLQQSAELLAKTQADAQKKLDMFRSSMIDQVQAMQKQSAIDQKTIADLKDTVAKMNDQNTTLQSSLSDLQKQVASYQQQMQTYAGLNNQFQQQVKTLSQTLKSPDVDIATLNAHAATIDDALAKNKAAADKTAKTTAQINAMLDALSKRASLKTPSTGK